MGGFSIEFNETIPLKATTASNPGSHTPQSYFQNLIVFRSNIWVVDGIQLIS